MLSRGSLELKTFFNSTEITNTSFCSFFGGLFEYVFSEAKNVFFVFLIAQKYSRSFFSRNGKRRERKKNGERRGRRSEKRSPEQRWRC